MPTSLSISSLRIALALVVSITTSLPLSGHAAGSCNAVPGVWDWFINGDVTFRSNGSLVQGSLGGRWQCANGTVTITWDHGYTDQLTLADDGRMMTGTNQTGNTVSGRKRGGDATPGPNPAGEVWHLVDRDYPLMGENVWAVTEGRNAGSSVKVRRRNARNVMQYIHIQRVRGELACRWISTFNWDEGLPETLLPGRPVHIDMEASLDVAHGQGCGVGRLSVIYGTRTEPTRDRAPNIRRLNEALAVPNGWFGGSSGSTEIFEVVARPDLPNNAHFTVAIRLWDGSSTNKIVAVYLYEKARRF